ncbi:MAG TPA: STAS domain-containing protein [Solirubrobacteraceae bacterium]|jgi:anti-sigma B factor antagonist|nr:STAS domain-containing protein [Solirubrobacteraceae bacterium]
MLTTADTSSQEDLSGSFGIIQSQPDERTSVVSLEGELDLGRAPSLKWALVDSVDAGYKQLIVDLTRVRFMDSTALSVLVGVNRSLDAGARLAIVCVNTNVLKIFELSGMDGAFAIFPTVDEALAHVQGSTARIG